jgi:hypothetical protein
VLVEVDTLAGVTKRLKRLTCGNGTKNTARVTAATATTVRR